MPGIKGIQRLTAGVSNHVHVFLRQYVVEHMFLCRMWVFSWLVAWWWQ